MRCPALKLPVYSLVPASFRDTEVGVGGDRDRVKYRERGKEDVNYFSCKNTASDLMGCIYTAHCQDARWEPGKVWVCFQQCVYFVHTVYACAQE